MRSILILPVLLTAMVLAGTGCAAEAPPQEVWNKTYGEAGDEWADLVVQTSDSSYIFAGSSSSYNRGNTELWLVKLESDQIERDDVSTRSGAIPEKPMPGYGILALVVSVVIMLFRKRKTPCEEVDFK